MANITQDSVLNALRTVMDPDLRKDLVTLNMIRDLKIENGNVSLRVVLTTPACPLKGKIEADVKKALATVAGIGSIQVKMDAEVRARSGGMGQGVTQIPGVQNIIAVSSGKGGVGKSTVAVNLATSLALEGARVGLMDADIYGPNIPTMMGAAEAPRIAPHPEKGEVFYPPTSHGVKVISMGFLVEGDQPLVWRGPMLHSVVSQFCHKVEWGELDYLIVDMPPGTGDVQLSLAQLVPVTGAVLVTTPQEVSMQDVRKAYNMFEKVRIPIIGFVENMSYFICDGCSKRHSIFGTDGGKILAKKFNTELLGQVPILGTVREGGDEGRPVVIKSPESAPAVALREIARKVAQHVSILNSKNGDASEIVQIGKFD